MTSKDIKSAGEVSRRQFLKGAAALGAAAGIGFPTIVPSTVFGATAPSNLIQVAQIGCGRIARDSEMRGVCNRNNVKLARYVAVCDLDTVRIQDAKDLISTYYKTAKVAIPEIKGYGDYHEILADKSIDAVCISTPDHWHSQPAIEAALAGKAIYLQKPASLTIVEGRQMANVVKQTGVVFQQGSQQRSDINFRKAAELIRNGAIGKIKEIYIGLPIDDAVAKNPGKMEVPSNLNYEMWLGETPLVDYTEERVHPQSVNGKGVYSRPGWLRCEQFGAGMITGWGVHHFDIANWAMDWGNTGPLTVEAKAQFPAAGSLWDVHSSYNITATFPGGVVMHVSDKLPNGLKFVGENGQWIFVSRGPVRATASDPITPGVALKALDASDPKILKYQFKDSDTRLHASPKNDHHMDWLTAIKTKGETVAPAEAGHRACSISLVSHTAMKLGRKLNWDPIKERFAEDEANSMPMMSRPQRAPYGTNAVLAKAGIKI